MRNEADRDRATAEVILIVREILEIEEQLGPLLARREELERELGERVRLGSEPWIEVPQVIRTHVPDDPSFPIVVEVANRMTGKPNPLACPFSGCGYEAISEDDLADHIAGCQPDDAG